MNKLSEQGAVADRLRRPKPINPCKTTHNPQCIAVSPCFTSLSWLWVLMGVQTTTARPLWPSSAPPPTAAGHRVRDAVTIAHLDYTF